jgi:hypothetical protein
MEDRLENCLQEYLQREFANRDLARFYSNVVREVVVPWTEDGVHPAQANLIIAFSFGQRRNMDGNAMPDPVISPRLKRLVIKMATE